MARRVVLFVGASVQIVWLGVSFLVASSAVAAIAVSIGGGESSIAREWIGRIFGPNPLLAASLLLAVATVWIAGATGVIAGSSDRAYYNLVDQAVVDQLGHPVQPSGNWAEL